MFEQKIIPPTGEEHVLLCDLVEKMMRWDPAERLTAEEALAHKFFKLTV